MFSRFRPTQVRRITSPGPLPFARVWKPRSPRQWTRVTSDTGVGDPKASTAEKGREYAAAAVARIADFLAELAATSRDEMYEDPAD